jgi:hypothetical protein
MPDSRFDIFQAVPTGLFGPLVAPGAAIYARILLTLFEEWRKHLQQLSRENALYAISSVLIDPEAMSLTQDAVEESTEIIEEDAVQARATAILRYLIRRGWMRAETQADFTQTIIFPTYATRLLKALAEMATPAVPASQSLIFPIYDTLRAAIKEGDAEARLPQAHQQTGELLVALRELRDNIGSYLDTIVGQVMPREILNQMLTNYREDIQSRMLHLLHTTEHISRYRPEVIQALNQLERAGQIDAAAHNLFEKREYATIEEARLRLYEQAREIKEQFQTLDLLLEAIDVRHSEFVDAAVRSIELHLSSQSTTSGQLNYVLEQMLQKGNLTPHQFHETANSLIQLYQLSWLSPESLASPIQAGEPFMPEPEVVETPSEQELAIARLQVMLQMQQRITQDRVRKVTLQLLDGRTEADAMELPIASPEDLSLVIFVREFGRDGKLGYVIEEDPEAPWIEMGGVGFRAFRIKASPKENG